MLKICAVTGSTIEAMIPELFLHMAGFFPPGPRPLTALRRVSKTIRGRVDDPYTWQRAYRRDFF